MLVENNGYATKNRLFQLLPLFFLVTLGVMLGLVRPRIGLGAERISLRAGPLQDSISIQSLSTFAETGKVDQQLAFYADFVGANAMNQLRSALQRRFRMNLVSVSQLTYSPLGEDALKQLGTLIQTDAQMNGFYAIRGAWLQAASNPDGFTLVDFMKAFPSRSIHLNIGQLLQLQQLFASVSDYTDTTVKAIHQQAQQEAAAAPSGLSQLPDPIKPGPFTVSKSRFNLTRQTRSLNGHSTQRDYFVDLYLPEGKTTPAPIVLVSHGLGSTPAAFAYLGTHLASHGFVVAIPEHVGSGEKQFQDFLTGLSSSNVQLTSFVERPLDIKQVIDTLERRSQTDLAGRLDLSRIAVMGHSFGGYTALATAGATLNLERIQATCSAPDRVRLDLSFSFQCLNEVLPPFDTRVLKDARIKAAIAINPVASVVFGVKGMETLNVPTMLVGGSRDILAPLVPEQVNPFFWMKTPDKYLSVIVPAGHTAADATDGDKNPPPGSFAEFLSGPDPVLARQYIRALAVVFMQSYIGDRPEYRSDLNARFARSIQQTPLQLDLVQALTPEMVEQAYGGTPPIPFFPPPLPQEAITNQIGNR